jgi:HEAT repeat protein
VRRPGTSVGPRSADDPDLRRRRAALAGHGGDPRRARSYLDDTDPTVRAIALRALARAEALVVDDMIAAAADDDPTVRRAVGELIATRRDAELDPVLARLLDDDDASVVETASWAAGERERDAAPVLDRLIALTTTHQDALVREAAVAALGAIGDRRALPAVLQATTDRATVRRRAVLALAPFDGPEVRAALARASDDRDWQVRQAAEDLLH